MVTGLSRLGIRLLLVPALLAGLAGLPAHAQEAANGTLRGTVLDKDIQAPLGGVRVSIIELARTTTGSDDGGFVFQDVPPGSYTVSFAKDGFERQVLTRVVVTAGRLTDVRAEMTQEVVEMEEMVVTGADILPGTEVRALEIRAESVTLEDTISAELIKKAGVSDVAGALKLVVGANVVEGKYATVRGLSDRYTGTTLNGVRVPSADPRRRAVQLDLFPTGTIDSVTVSKTFTPDLQGEFTGGGVDIKTKSIPDGRVLMVSASGGTNSNATGNDSFLTYKGGGVEWTGFARSDRDLPDGADKGLPQFPSFRDSRGKVLKSTSPDFPAQYARSLAYDKLARSFSPVMGVERGSPGLDQSYSLVGGNRINLEGGGVVGLIGALSYSHKYDFYEGGYNNSASVSNFDPSSGLQISLDKERADSEGSDNLLIGALGAVVWKVNDKQQLTLRLIGNQSSQDEARFQEQILGNQARQGQALHYTERTVFSAQLHGDHTLGEHFTLDWTAARNLTKQNEPDTRFFLNTLDLTPGPSYLTGRFPSNSSEEQNTRRIFRDIDEDGTQGIVNVGIPFTQWTDTPGKIKLGIFTEDTHRDYTQNSFTYFFQKPPISFLEENPDLIRIRDLDTFGPLKNRDQYWTDFFLRPENIGIAPDTHLHSFTLGRDRGEILADNQLLWILEPTGNDVNYSGDQTIDAAYAMSELSLTPKLKAIFGARLERTSMSVVPVNELFGTVEVIITKETTNPLDPTAPPLIQRDLDPAYPQEKATADIDDSSLLPSVGLVWEVMPAMNVRASWSRTLARPTFRELAPIATEEFIDGDEFIGNPDLQLSKITNYDLRWEWFRRPGEVLAVSGFYKDIVDPIEYISFGASNRDFVQPVNFEKGRIQGVEIEARSTLDVIWKRLAGLTAGVNYTWIDSQVNVPDFEQNSLQGLTDPTRRLLGQPEYIFNANLSYDYPKWGTSASVFYNLVGETLVSGAARGFENAIPDIYERPHASLDIRLDQKLRKGVAVTFKAQNLLEPEITRIYRTPQGNEELKSLRPTASSYTFGVSWSW